MKTLNLSSVCVNDYTSAQYLFCIITEKSKCAELQLLPNRNWGKFLRIIYCRICIIQYTKNVLLYNVQKMYSTMNHNGTGKITFKNSSQISVKLSTFSR